jgi:peptide deformylase
MLNIITQPNPILRQKAKEIKIEEIAKPETQKLVAEMLQTMLAKDGVGLAAPQVSKSIRLVVINRKVAAGKGDPLVIFNPKFLTKSLRKEKGEEGCLSVPGYFGIVKRHKGVYLQYLDQTGACKKIKAKSLLARVIQHELDHLDGILFIDKAEKIFQIEPK